jgi:hypothetical protein
VTRRGFDPTEARDYHGRWSKTGGAWHRLEGLMRDGGFTHINGIEPTKGYAVGIPSPTGKDWRTLPYGTTTAADIEAFARDFADELSKPNRGIGGWSNHNPEWGEVRDALDIVEVHPDVVEAAAAAKAAGQDALYNIEAGEELPLAEALRQRAKEVLRRSKAEKAVALAQTLKEGAA